MAYDSRLEPFQAEPKWEISAITIGTAALSFTFFEVERNEPSIGRLG
jgi:hypothetical protein